MSAKPNPIVEQIVTEKNISAKKVIKQVLVEKNISIKELADKIGLKTPSMHNKMSRDNFTFAETIAILDLLGADVKVVILDTKKELQV